MQAIFTHSQHEIVDYFNTLSNDDKKIFVTNEEYYSVRYCIINKYLELYSIMYQNMLLTDEFIGKWIINDKSIFTYTEHEMLTLFNMLTHEQKVILASTEEYYFVRYCILYKYNTLYQIISEYVSVPVTCRKRIFFNKRENPYYEFSNFYGCDRKDVLKLNIDGRNWLTAEHYFQAQKFTHQPEYMELIYLADTANKVRMLGTQEKRNGYAIGWKIAKGNNVLVNDAIDQSLEKGIKPIDNWDQICVDVMRRALYAKFTQNSHLKRILLDTENAEIIDDKDQNMLGMLLMEIRDSLMP